jgi:hypothetical protein
LAPRADAAKRHSSKREVNKEDGKNPKSTLQNFPPVRKCQRE